jgi:DNA repair protein RecN (Recombination protein N)
MMKLNQKKEIIHNSGKIADGLSQAYSLLYNEDGFSAKLQVDEAIHQIAAIANYSPALSDCRDKLSDISYNLLDIVDTLREMRDGMEYDSSNIESIERRLDLIYRLKKKYGSSVNEILEYAKEIQVKLDSMENREAEIAKLDNSLKQELAVLKEKAEMLSKTRKMAADKLQDLAEKELSYLDMPKARFLAQIQRCEYNSEGADTVAFLLAPNMGETPKPLAKIASGGELSRIMLAIKSIIGDADTVDTLIFDEIDTGVSGKAAQKIGFKMKRIAKNRQTICVTHLAQIAALADNHLKISKSSLNNKTFTSVKELSYTEKIDELAVIMGGMSTTETTKLAAKELLDKSNDTGEMANEYL